MMAIIDPTGTKGAAPDRTGATRRRLLWFVGLWLAGVGTVALVSLLLRAWIAP